MDNALFTNKQYVVGYQYAILRERGLKTKIRKTPQSCGEAFSDSDNCLKNMVNIIRK